MVDSLAEILKGHLAKQGWSFKRLANEAGLPPNTVHRWTRGEVKRVRHWHDLAKTARTLNLNRSQTDALLQAGGHPAIEVLLERATAADDRELLARWTRTTPHTLPAQLTSFVGRRQELDRLTELLASTRLVTLTGPGGSGKSRLAIEAAQTVLDEFEEVCFVDLSTIHDPGLVIPAISQALGLPEAPDASLPRALRAHLRDKTVLLVLDNFEQIIAAAPHVAELLRSTDRAKVMVTSRMRLNVRGEHELAVPPLPLPSPAASIEELSRNPSVALFTDRARAANAAFRLTPESGPLVAEVCARLDGLPLGIELAAARIRQVAPGSMLARFPDRLALAGDGPRDAPDRQRTLRQTIAWSYNLLDPDARHLLACASVFAGGFTEQAIASVAGAHGQPSVEVSRSLTSLVEQSLVRQVWGADEPCRYEMLETIREFAREQMHASGNTHTVTNAASAYYLDLAERAELEGAGQATWLPRLVAELDNFRAALSWYREHGHAEAGLRLSLALVPLWLLRDHPMEARAWLDAFMANAAEIPPALRAKGLLWQGLLLMRGTGDDVAASRLFAEALAVFRDIDDPAGISETLQAEGDVYREQRDWRHAARWYAESVELAERAGNAYLVAHGHMGLALCAQEVGHFDDAQHHWQLTLEWAERAEQEPSVALALNSLGEMARHRGAWDEAEHWYERSLRLARELDSEFRIALALHNLGYAALARSETERARGLFTKSLALYEGRQYLKGQAECLAGLGNVEASAGSPERAAHMCGASEAILDGLATRLDTLDRADYERTLACLRRHLGERLEALLDEGRSMSMESAVAYALTGCRAMSEEARPQARQAPPSPNLPA